jgi:hypothetical protein
MSSFLVCWYALGWVASGLEFATRTSGDRVPIFLCFINPPLVFLIVMAGAIFRLCRRIQRHEQYLWRKP